LSAFEKGRFTLLKRQLAYARANSPYYRRTLRDTDIDSIHDRRGLAALPLTPSDALRKDPRAFLSVGESAAARIATLNTSGTTGDTKRIWFSEADLQRTVDFFILGLSHMVKPGGRAAVFMSGPAPGGLGGLLHKAFAAMGVFPIIHGPVTDIASAVHAADGADLVVGLPAQLNRLCLTAPGLRPGAALLTGDYIPRGIIDNVKSSWGSSVYTHYGLTESGYGLAYQCMAAEAHHLRDGEFIAEIVDPSGGRPLEDGSWGELVITSLMNEAMPLIRYRTGDITRLITAPCACGHARPRLDRIMGRAANIGRKYSIHKLDEAMFRLPGLLDYSASVQEDRLDMIIDSLIKYDDKAVRASLEAEGVHMAALRLEYRGLPVYSGPQKKSVCVHKK
jgi:phenylacetate-coenzyme A ligase PaaK-like adenylate-forming protein